MQTPQVANPAALFTTASPAAKKADTNTQTQSFGQLLSREVAERQPASMPAAKEASPASGKETKSSPASAPAPSPSSQTANARASAADARQPVKHKSASEKNSAKDEPSDTKEASAQSPEDLLAMVANLVQMTSPADAVPAEALAQDTQPTVDPAMLLAAAGMLRADQPAARADKPDMQSLGKTLDVDARRAGARDMMLEQALKPQADAATEGKPADDLAALAAKGQELLVGGDAESVSPEFAAKLQDTLAQGPAAVQAAPHLAQVQAAARTLETRAADRLSPAVGSTAWDQALGQKVVWMVAGEQQSASLTLNPPDLGPLQIVLNVSNSQATATFTAAQPEVRQALEAAMPKLRDMLGEAGIQLGQATVNSGSPNQQNQQDQSSAARQGRQNNGNGNGIDGPGAANAQAGRVAPSSGGNGMVDTFV